jgi:hypothetical protein
MMDQRTAAAGALGNNDLDAKARKKPDCRAIDLRRQYVVDTPG